MLKFSLSFLFGVSQLLWLPELKLIWLIPMSLMTLLSYYFIKQSNKTLLLIFGFSIGFIYAVGYGHYAKSHQLVSIPDSHIRVIGKVSNLPIDKNNKLKFSFNINQIEGNYNLKKILISWYNTDEIVKAGQIWQFDLKLKPIHGYKNPGSFDYSKWLFRQGYDATATVKTAQLFEDKSYDLNSIINTYRASLSQLIERKILLPRIQALIKALTIGDKSQISYEDSQLFQETGTAHLIAISGLHIGLMAFLGVLCGRLVFLFMTNEKFNRFKYEAIFAIGFALIYSLLAGFSIPTIRALIMVIAFSMAYVIKKQISRWQAWSIALIIVLSIDPLSVLDVGFWFSFGAVAALMFAFTGKKINHNRIKSFGDAQIVILIGLLPLMVIVFGKINLLTPIANLIVLPLASLLLIPLLFASFLVHVFSESLASYLFNFVEKITNILFMILDYLQQFNFLTIPINKSDKLSFFSLTLVAIILLLPKLFRWRYITLILLIPVFLIKPNELNQGEFQVNVLDVGQGLSVVVTTTDHTLLYDTGAKFETGFNLASTVVIPYLYKQGISHVDKLILSHKDNDHAGGVEEMKSEYLTMELYDVAGQYKDCKKGLFWKWNDVRFEVLSPFNIDPYLGNNSTCVIKISNQYSSFLLTGDIEEPVEYRLINQLPKNIQSDVLLVPHHGSRTSSSLNFLNSVDPKIALNSSGYNNQFNHPHPKIKQQYLDRSIEFLDTQDKGMIELKFSNSEIKFHQYSDSNRRFWQVH
jgi:competence protein ComEC